MLKAFLIVVAICAWNVIVAQDAQIVKSIKTYKSGKAVVRDYCKTLPKCSHTPQITIPSTCTKEGVVYNVTDISFSFKNCKNLTSVTIPNSVEEILSSFEDCNNLKKIQFSDRLKVINDCFNGCKNLTSIVIPIYLYYYQQLIHSHTQQTHHHQFPLFFQICLKECI